ncbi:hypothetical protein [Streptomyces sp. NBC_01314]|uniref:hypothetical protein n=1 Tax=Streptomyces sp. NBC_01314 TaxID=2903821 RepID=UPI003084D9D5|nr:hypothetical protein OG622_28345 [Streptomyces sp. NBC_01314]
MSRHLQHLLHSRLDTAAAVLDLPLTRDHLERLAVELTPAVKALLLEADDRAAEHEPVEYTLTEQAAPADRHVTEYNGCRSSIHPEVDEDAPAALLALEWRGMQPDITSTDVPTRTHLTITVRPQSLRAWDWWLNKAGVAVDSTRRHGQLITGTGYYGEITVYLRGENVGQLLDDQVVTASATRLTQFIGGHPW